ncbi:DUF305 domain-containing protein [Microbacterium lacus]|uniref:DUF305 domain-containing protein n=1 Tax=Microbacterium lacus TaxID=415217 RepID=UPI00385030D3
MSRRVAGIGVCIAAVTGAGALAIMVMGLIIPAPETGATAQGSAPLSVGAAPDGFPVAADYCFIEGMIPHHEQALELSELVLGAADARERTHALAAFIERDQSAEIATMQKWQDAWAAAVPAAEAAASAPSHQSAHAAHSAHETAGKVARGCGSHIDHSLMKGMATPDQLAELEGLARTDGAAADRLFLELMIVHHEGALEMATVAVKEGSNAFVRSTAKHVLIEQEREIAAMAALLEEVP